MTSHDNVTDIVERWHSKPDPNQAQHDAVDQERRKEEAEAQQNMTDATCEAAT